MAGAAVALLVVFVTWAMLVRVRIHEWNMLAASPDGSYLVHEAIGDNAIGEYWSIWLKRHGDSGFGTRITDWAWKPIGIVWIADSELWVWGESRRSGWTLMGSCYGVTIRRGR